MQVSAIRARCARAHSLPLALLATLVLPTLAPLSLYGHAGWSGPPRATAREIVGADTSRVVAIRAGRLIDGTGATVAEGVVILVRGDRIEAVGRDVRPPAGAEVIDLSDATVMPGFIDMHTHITGDPSFGYSDHLLHEWPGYAAIVGVKNARLTLLAGFTTIRNVGSDDFADVALEQAIEANIVPGPRMYVASHSIGITGGHCDRSVTGARSRPLPDEVRRGVDQVLCDGRRVVGPGRGGRSAVHVRGDERDRGGRGSRGCPCRG